MRDKLIEILRKPIFTQELADPTEAVADYLLDNGVIVLPCKVGDDLWWIDGEDCTVKVDKGGVKGIAITADGVRIMDGCGGYDEIGTQYCYLTREEAEAALKEGQE